MLLKQETAIIDALEIVGNWNRQNVYFCLTTTKRCFEFHLSLRLYQFARQSIYEEPLMINRVSYRLGAHKKRLRSVINEIVKKYYFYRKVSGLEWDPLKIKNFFRILCILEFGRWPVFNS